MNYPEALAYLDGFVNFERGALTRKTRALITLDRVRELAGRLGNPQDRFASLHVAGTKGKGSTCAFAESILRAAGLKTGLYVSPHLQDVRERISISGHRIPEADFARMLSACMPALEAMRHPPAGERRPTYFEALTHLAFTWFAEENVDVAVVEVGLGGRLDATNILREPRKSRLQGVVASAITNISADHQAILGDTLEQIAREKAGILKHGAPVVIAPQLPEVARTLEECAKNAGAPVVNAKVKTQNAKVMPDAWPLPVARAQLADGTVYEAELGLHGAHQAENWAVAVSLASLYWKARTGERLPAGAVAKGSRNVRWPGRLEELSARPRVILDGAHNDYSLKTMLLELRNLPGERRPLTVLFACAKDKDAAAMLRALSECAILREVIFTHSGNTRGKDPDELAAAWRELTGRAAAVHASCADGLAAARKAAGNGGTVLVTGSLYLVGAIKDCILLNTQ